jgi:DNA repair exonuclease SbcCD nuclease subunit
MKILFVGDIHIKQDNIPDIDILQSKIEEYISEQPVDWIVLGGDILHYHERLHTLTMKRAVKFIKDLATNVPVYVLVGNHDMINNQQYLNDNHWMVVLKDIHPNIHIVDYPLAVEGICMCPYVFPGKFKETLSLLETDFSTYKLIFAHQEFKGCKMGAIVSEEGDVWEESLPVVISGHIHNKQRPQSNILYPGTPIQHSFGDVGDDNCMLLVTLSDTIEWEEISLSISQKRIVYATIEQLKKMDPVKYASKDIKIVVKATHEEIQAFKKSTIYTKLSKVLNITFKTLSAELVETNETTPFQTFETILHDMIVNKHPHLMKDYKTIFSS